MQNFVQFPVFLRHIAAIVAIACVFAAPWPEVAFSQARSVAGTRVMGTVAFVADGDTLRLEGGQWVRLAGIDAPELGRDGRMDQYFAVQSRKILKELALGLKVEVILVGKGGDRHGRLVGIVRPSGGGQSFNLDMVSRGAAFCYPHRDNPYGMQDVFVQAQRRAMDHGLGFWPVILPLASGPEPWIGNAASGRAFPEGSVRVSRRNRIEFKNLKEAFRAGFSPARHVTPWPVDRAVKTSAKAIAE